MSTIVKSIPRLFIFSKDKEQIILEDLNPNLPAKDIAELYSNQYPELLNATMITKGVNDKDELEFEFKAIAGTKG